MQNSKPYPTKKVIFTYGLIAPLIGSLIFILMSFMANIGNLPNLSRLGLAILQLIIIIATLLAIIPAFITGFWIAKNKTYIKNNKDYAYLFAKGLISCCVFLILLAILFSLNDVMSGLPFEYLPERIYVNFLKEYPAMLIFAVIGGISAMICGKLFLPKSPNNF